MDLEPGKASRLGRERGEHQDRALTTRSVFGVFDGTGPEGARAAQEAARAIQESLEDPAAAADPEQGLRTAFARAHAHVRGLVPGVGDPRTRPLRPSAACAAVVYQATHGLYLAHAGDCRAYLLRRGQAALGRERARVELLTQDHHVEWFFAQRGEAVPRGSNPRHIAYAIGGEIPPVPDVIAVDAQDGDVLLLCSDGLWDAFEAAPEEQPPRPSRLWVVEAILSGVGIAQSPSEAAESLVALAMGYGAEDDATALIIRARPKKSPPKQVLAWLTVQTDYGTDTMVLHAAGRLREKPGGRLELESPPAMLLPEPSDIDLALRPGGWWQLESRAAVKINGFPIHAKPASGVATPSAGDAMPFSDLARASLADGDRVEIGATSFVFKAVCWPEAPASSRPKTELLSRDLLP